MIAKTCVYFLTIVCLGIVGLRTAWAEPEISSEQWDSVPKEVQAQILEQWGPKNESSSKKALNFLPRLIGHTVEMIAIGKTTQRLANVGAASVHLVKGFQQKSQLDVAAYKSADSILNPGASLSDLLSDLVGVLKSPVYATSKLSKRIQICTNNLQSSLSNNLTPAHQIMPAEHVAFMIDDGIFETQDPRADRELHNSLDKGGIICLPVPLLKNESESIAIERLNCVNSEYRQRFNYDFLSNNCGTYSLEIARLAGLGYPILPNFGVGIVNEKRSEEKIAALKDTAMACDNHLDFIRLTIFALESGRSLTDAQTTYFNTLPTVALTDDTVLQFFISAARGRNSGNRGFVEHLWRQAYLRSYLLDSSTTKARSKNGAYRRLIEMSRGLDQEALAWIQLANPAIFNLYAN